MKKLAVIAGMVAMSAVVSNAAIQTWSGTAPAVNGGDVANFTDAGTDAGNVNSGDDVGTYVANNQPGKLQTFTTGNNANGYFISGFSYQQAAYDHAFSVDDGWIGWGGYWASFGTVSGTDYNIAYNEFAEPGSTAAFPTLDAGGGQFGTANAWFNIAFESTGYWLAPNTQYAISLWSDNPYFELAGTSDSNAYTGGEAFGETAGTVAAQTGDHVFHVDLVAIPEPATMGLLGFFGAGILFVRRRFMI